MSKKVLIANRGEISLRAIRACKELGLKTVCIYSEGDKELKSLRFSDESVCVGPADPTKSYLDAPTILSAADVTGSDAIYPGYGFLAEDHSFAEQCNLSGFKFIGPSSETIRQMGDKITAKSIVTKYGIDGVPGFDNELPDNEQEILKIADEIGYPLIVKATAGGGGRGMKIVRSSKELINSVQIAKQEALNGFGNDIVYFEKFIENPRHIEIQVVGDGKGNAIHLGTRDCSIQRRHQKLIEEAPARDVNKKKLDEVLKNCVNLCKDLNYEGVGTLEFLYEKECFYFLEMNTRIQVEHPVTEMITGIDIVRQQLLIASGEKVGYTQEQVELRGHAIECRINAENSETFIPCPGTINQFHAPGGPGVRMDTHIYNGYKVPPNYDSMIGKLISYGNNRDAAIRRMSNALNEIVIDGIETNIDLQKKLILDTEFQKGGFSINYLESKIKN